MDRFLLFPFTSFFPHLFYTNSHPYFPLRIPLFLATFATNKRRIIRNSVQVSNFAHRPFAWGSSLLIRIESKHPNYVC